MKKLLSFVLPLSLLFLSCQVAPTSTSDTPKTSTPEETLQPSRTPRATFTPYVVPTPFLTPGVKTYILPEWLKSTDNNVALLADRNESPDFWAGEFNQITLIDVEAGESITFEVDYFDEVFWQDRNNIIFLHDGYCTDYRYVSTLNILSGNVIRYGVNEGKRIDYCPFLVQEKDPKISVPTDNLDYFSLENLNNYETKFVANYESSPDGKFIAFNYGDGCSRCDYYYGVGRAIVSADGELLYNSDHYQYYDLMTYWRPLQ